MNPMPAIVSSARTLGRALRDARRRQKLSQQALAERSGVAQPTISNLERGTTHASLDTILRVTAALGLELLVQPRRGLAPATPWEAQKPHG
jgi:HTH-type transcriptional regulator/antitoxin HipB